MNKDEICALCKKKGFFRTPELNEQLYLHFQGYEKIENLEAFTGCRVLWLENNSLSRIENLEQMSELLTLYVHHNRLEGSFTEACSLPRLDSLNCSHNQLESCKGIGEKFPMLSTVNISHNRLTDAGLSDLAQTRHISVLDLSFNNISDISATMSVLTSLPRLASLKLQGNPLVNATKNYRRTVLAQLPSLSYLDDYPVFAEERRAVTAWKEGGFEAERVEKQLIKQEADAERDGQRRFFEDFCSKAKQQSTTLDQSTPYFLQNQHVAEKEIKKRPEPPSQLPKAEESEPDEEVFIPPVEAVMPQPKIKTSVLVVPTVVCGGLASGSMLNDGIHLTEVDNFPMARMLNFKRGPPWATKPKSHHVDPLLA